jgi:hypothetical protein
MQVEVKLEKSTFDDLAEMSIPLSGETANDVIVRLIGLSKTPQSRTKRKTKKIGRAIKSLIRQGCTNQTIFDIVTIDFPTTRIKTPGEISHYRSVMKKEARDKRRKKKR